MKLPISSQKWLNYVSKAIKGGEFELPWSAEENQTFDRDKIVAGAKESQRVYYTLIGECYVHLMMDGEAIEWQAKGTDDPDERWRKTPRMFELR